MSVQVVSNVHYVVSKVDEAIEKAAVMIGGSLEGHAKEAAPVDTGLLRNSITYAIGGEAPNIPTYTDDSGGKTGTYDGTAPKDEDDQTTVYVGTNVEYGPYQELGAPNINLPARPFIRPAFENNQREISQILLQCFRGLG